MMTVKRFVSASDALLKRKFLRPHPGRKKNSGNKSMGSYNYLLLNLEDSPRLMRAHIALLDMRREALELRTRRYAFTGRRLHLYTDQPSV